MNQKLKEQKQRMMNPEEKEILGRLFDGKGKTIMDLVYYVTKDIDYRITINLNEHEYKIIEDLSKKAGDINNLIEVTLEGLISKDLVKKGIMLKKYSSKPDISKQKYSITEKGRNFYLEYIRH